MFKKSFNNMSRVGNYNCSLSQRDLQNTKSNNYVMENYSASCLMNDAINVATSQPDIFYKGGHQVGVDGCNIDENSNLMHSKLTREKERNTLYSRQFLTVPYLGRGKNDPAVESHIQRGDYNLNTKTNILTSEQTHLNHRHYPLIPSIQATINNPNNLVEGVAEKGWVRGGVPSRELHREQEHYK